MDEIKNRLKKLLERLNIEEKKRRIRFLEAESARPTFWQEPQAASEKMKEIASLQKEVKEIEKLKLLLEEGKEEEAGRLLAKSEALFYLSGKYDQNHAILSIHAGQGGTEAMDWAQMLYRMYTRFFEKKGWSWEVIEETRGEEAGVKSVIMTVLGGQAYGYLKGEAGVHRLVRQSPFNADRLRQTSFALVETLPIIEDTREVGIKDEDLEWKFFRASSHGGQNVQKVSSAVRLRHKPTGIVVTCQAERYQAQNREYALKLLRAKLWVLEEETRKRKERELKGGYKVPGWGNQIRSYVLHPYHLIKDLRTGYETNQIEEVLNGNLDSFIETELRGLPNE